MTPRPAKSGGKPNSGRVTASTKRARSSNGSKKRTGATKAVPARSAASPPDGAGRAKRPDALRNRERILRAAYAVFADQGVDAQMVDIAAAAGVGVATLYRNFQTKEELVNALLDEYFARAVVVAQQAVEEEDAWQALVRFFQWVTSLQLEDRALSQFIAGHIQGSEQLRDQRVNLYEILNQVALRAKEQGILRPDVNVTDLRAGLGAIALVSSAGFPERVVRRLVGVIIDGLRAPGQTTLEGPPYSTEDLEAAIQMERHSDEQIPRALKRGRRPWPVRGGA